MIQIKSDKHVYTFSSENAPVLTVPAGSTVEIETLDCFENQLRTSEDTLEALDWDRTNPVTGPICVEGAAAGDTLKITIEKILLNEKGTVMCGAGMGTLGHLIHGNYTKIIEIKDNMAQFSPDLKLPLNPMIGVIGAAPEQGASINTGTPGHHGGNMDNVMITEGAVLYIPVFTEGAGFALGDVHAVMGDGEIGVTGLEIPAEVTVTLDIIKGKAEKEPVLENNQVWSVIVSRETLDQAADDATEIMYRFIADRCEMTEDTITMLMSLVGQLEICQIVDPLKTVRFVIPKQYFPDIRF